MTLADLQLKDKRQVDGWESVGKSIEKVTK